MNRAIAQRLLLSSLAPTQSEGERVGVRGGLFLASPLTLSLSPEGREDLFLNILASIREQQVHLQRCDGPPRISTHLVIPNVVSDPLRS